MAGALPDDSRRDARDAACRARHARGAEGEADHSCAPQRQAGRGDASRPSALDARPRRSRRRRNHGESFHGPAPSARAYPRAERPSALSPPSPGRKACRCCSSWRKRWPEPRRWAKSTGQSWSSFPGTTPTSSTWNRYTYSCTGTTRPSPETAHASRLHAGVPALDTPQGRLVQATFQCQTPAALLSTDENVMNSAALRQETLVLPGSFAPTPAGPGAASGAFPLRRARHGGKDLDARLNAVLATTARPQP